MPEARSGGTSKAAPRKKPAAKKKTTASKKRASAKPKPPGKGSLRVKQTRSGIGHARTYRRTLEALGLRHHQHEIVVPDSPSTRGMLRKVRHLVHVTPEEA